MPDNSAMSCAEMAKLTEMPFEFWTLVGPRKHVVCTLRHLANTIELSMLVS